MVLKKDEIKKAAEKMARDCGKIQMKKFGKNLTVKWKAVTDPVTEVDHACEKLISKRVKKLFPGHCLIAEEGYGFGDEEASEYVWYADPLDGTVNYSHGIPLFNVSIGVYKNGKPYVGVVHAAALNETYVAQKGKGAFLNGKRIKVSKQTDPLKSLTVSGFAYQARKSGENVREWMQMLRNFQAIRRIGSAAIDLCWVAAGRFDGFWEYGLKTWDMAAGELMVTEAGGKVTTLENTKFDLHGQRVLATNGKLHAPMARTLKKAWKNKLHWPPK